MHSIQDDHQDTTCLDHAIGTIKLALKAGNARVSSAGLSCSLALFELLSHSSRADATSGDGEQHEELDHLLGSAVADLVAHPGVMAYLGDSREVTRDLAGRVLLQAGKAVASNGAGGDAKAEAGTTEGPLASLDRLVKEQGFASKNARTREQVWMLTSIK